MNASRYSSPSPAVFTASVVLFATAIFLNASLLFAIEPLFTKMVLPLLGGTPSVWNTNLLFFQGALMVGYLYAHLTSRRLSVKAQGALHIGLLVIAIAVLPVQVPRGILPEPGASLPVLWLLALLAVSLGLPFTLLAAGAPILQRWFAESGHPRAGNPYVLYVASNLGSFAALLAYPTLIEPRLSLGTQSRVWAFAYVGLVALIVATLALGVWLRTNTPVQPVNESGGDVEGEAQPEDPEAVQAVAEDRSLLAPSPTRPHPRGMRLRWTLLSFAPSSLLLGITTYLSTDVVSVPLLWVGPLAIYLLTFVLVFAERPPLNRRFVLAFQLLIAIALLVTMGITPTKLKIAHLSVHFLGFFATAMMCHRELADSRPHPEHLTEFYFWMSFGGLLGGVFNVLLAPVMYDRVLEYPYALIIALGLRPGLQRLDMTRRKLALDIAFPIALYYALLWSFEIQVPEGKWGIAILAGSLAIAGMIVVSFYHRPFRLALGAAALFFAIDGRSEDADDDLLYQKRSFFGVYRVQKWGDYVILQSGTTTHGSQSLDQDRRREPLTYYAKAGPLGDVFAGLTDTTARRSVAVVGLGAGTTACYANPGEQWTFYEIDPAVVQIAQSRELFSYLKDCQANAQMALGDARLSMRTAVDSSYDLILLDAFSSDAIPVHLMTREALALYLRKLKPTGTVVFHISNRYLELEPVLAELARDARVAGAIREYDASAEEKEKMWYSSSWVAVARDAATLAPLTRDRAWRPLAPSADVRLWTDDFTDILSVMRWRED